jgi:hypothetical protein
MKRHFTLALWMPVRLSATLNRCGGPWWDVSRRALNFMDILSTYYRFTLSAITHKLKILYISVILLLLLFILTANGFLAGGSGSTVRHNAQITHLTQNNTSHSKPSTQSYTKKQRTYYTQWIQCVNVSKFLYFIPWPQKEILIHHNLYNHHINK